MKHITDENLALEIKSCILCLKIIYCHFINSRNDDCLFYFGNIIDDLNSKIQPVTSLVVDLE